MVKILQSGNLILRKISRPVEPDEIKSAKIKKIIKSMDETLKETVDGVALAAPQIGYNLRIFIISPKAFQSQGPALNPPKGRAFETVFINPQITKHSSRKKTFEEGCLSVKDVYGKIKRSEKITVRALDEKGKTFTRGASGLLAEILQHEIDHLEGVLFIDSANDLKEVKRSIVSRLDRPILPNMKFVFFGTSEFSIIVLTRLIKSGFSPSIIITTPDKPAKRGYKLSPPSMKIWAQNNNIPFIQPANLKNEALISQLKNDNYELFIIAGYGKIIPKDYIVLPRYGSVNIHPSILPKYRGPTPIQSAILAGETQIGVTIMLVDEEIDHGPILSSIKYQVLSIKTYRELEKELAELGGELLVETIPKWLAGEIKAVPQDHDKATLTRKFTTQDAFIEPEIVLQTPAQTSDVEEAYRKVLALNPEPGTWTIIRIRNKEVRIKITEAELKDGKFILAKVIPAGKRQMSWVDFQRGNMN